MWNIEEMTGYKPITTFWQDFSIAEIYGEAAIKETYMRVMHEWMTDYTYMTELSLVLNWKCWRYSESEPDLCELYRDLYYKHDEWFYDFYHKNQEAKDYYWSKTD